VTADVAGASSRAGAAAPAGLDATRRGNSRVGTRELLLIRTGQVAVAIGSMAGYRAAAHWPGE
jgi:hypothetical protein